jgi:hypothetical protein
LVVLSTFTATGQKSSAVQPYEDVDAYEIYNLLLPHEESYAFAGDVLMIQEHAVAEDISGACLKQADANRFKGAIAGYNRAREKKWLFKRHFQLTKSYRIVGAEGISALPDRPQGAGAYVRMSPVGFNHGKTQAIVFIKSSCGGLCGNWMFHFLEKAHGKWKEAAIATCAGAS